MPTLHHLLAATLCAVPATAQLVGLYTINPSQPASGTNFLSFAAATADLTTQGVSGPVTFDVYDDAGPFTEANSFLPTGLWAPDTAVLVMRSWSGTSPSSRVTFRAAAGEAPVIDASGRAIGIYWGGADYVTIEGFEIRNAVFDAVSLYSDSVAGVPFDAVIRECRIHHCGGAGVSIYGNSSFPVNTLVENNWFWNLQETASGSFYGTGRFGYVTTRRTTNTRVVHNTFLVNTGVGSMLCALGAYPSSVSEVPYAEVSNNIFMKTQAAGRPILRILSPVGSTAPVPTICDSNCFFDYSTSPLAMHGDNGTTISTTLLDWQTNVQRDLGSIVGLPMFSSTVTIDLHLTSTSPCIGASTMSSGTTDDIDGQPRTTSLDIGADEYSNASIRSVGQGCLGSAQQAPVLSQIGWPYLGSPDFALLASQLPPSAPVFVFASFGTAPPYAVGAGCQVQLALPSLVALPVVLTASSVGTSSVVIAWPANPAYVGVNYGFQAMVIDAGAPLGITLTNALDIVLGF